MGSWSSCAGRRHFRSTDPRGLRSLGFGDLRVQEFGSPQDVLVRFENKAQPPGRATNYRGAGSQGAARCADPARRGGRRQGQRELFRNGLLATRLALIAVWLIWFRFEWQFGVGVVATLILDVTKTVGFFAVTQFEFDLNSVAALLTLIGYSVTDKVVVYDRIRENLGKHGPMPLRPVDDLSQPDPWPDGRNFADGVPVDLSARDDRRRGHARFCAGDHFRIVVGTSSSIFIASPILLFLGEKRLRPGSPGLRPPRPRLPRASVGRRQDRVTLHREPMVLGSLRFQCAGGNLTQLE